MSVGAKSKTVTGEVFDDPFALVNAPAGSVIVCVPPCVTVKVKVTLHEPFAGIVSPLAEIEPPPAGAVTVPPHVDVGAVAPFTTPAGLVIENAPPLMGVPEGFVKVIVSVVLAPVSTVAGFTDSEIVGAPSVVTSSVALAAVALGEAFAEVTEPAAMLLV